MASQLAFSGEEIFDAPRARVYEVLTDLPTMARMIPDLASHEVVDAKTMRCVVRPGFSFLRGTMKLVLRIDDSQRPEAAAMTVDAEGIGVAMQIASTMRLERAHVESAADAAGEKTRLKWSAEASQLKGLIATISPALVKAAAEQVVRRTWDKVRERLK